MRQELLLSIILTSLFIARFASAQSEGPPPSSDKEAAVSATEEAQEQSSKELASTETPPTPPPPSTGENEFLLLLDEEEQEAKPETDTNKKNEFVFAIEEIVITATKRETNLQDTPVAVTALTGDSLERQQVVDLKSVTTFIPNLQIGANSESAAVDLAMRGIVSTNRTELGDPAVAFHVDGFYSPRPQGATILLYDLERIEVLRGPQGTLFGRNANAGVVNVSTAKPDFSGASTSADLTVGDYNLLRAKGHLNAPIYDKLAIRGAVYVEKRDGFIDFQEGSRVPTGAAKYDNSDQVSFRVSGLWEPVPALKIFVSGEQFINQGAGKLPVLIEPREGTKLRSALIDSPGTLDLKNTTFHGRLDFKPLDWLHFSYLGGWARMTRSNVTDGDIGISPETHFQQETRTQASTFLSQSHEIQIKTANLDFLDLIVGGFLYFEDNDIRFDIDYNDDPDNDGLLNQYWALSFVQPKRELSSIAGFGQATIHILDSLRLTGGARYTSDTKSDTGGLNLVCPAFGATFEGGGINLRDVNGLPLAADPFGAFPYPDGQCGSFPGNTGNDVEKTWSQLTWMGRIEWNPARKWLVYGTVNTGFKSGVIQDAGLTADPEFVTNFEVGMKTRLFDGALVINPVGFYSDYTDILRSLVETAADGTTGTVTRNATSARIFGLETEIFWFITGQDRLQLMLNYLNAEYRDFPTIDNVLYATNDPDSPIVNLEGNKLPFAPEFSMAAAYEHTFLVGRVNAIIPRIQTQIQTAMHLSDFNRTVDRQEAFTRTDVSIRYVTQSGWLAEIFVKNIEDRTIKSNVEIRGSSPGTGGVPGDPGLAYAYFDPPRTFGARLAYHWFN